MVAPSITSMGRSDQCIGRGELAALSNSSGPLIVNEHHAVTDEDAVTDHDTATDECVTLNLALVPDHCTRLDLNERPYL